MKRLLFPAVLFGAAGVVLAGMAPAQAAPPQVQSGYQDLPARDANGGGFCLFPARVDYVVKQRAQESTNPDGSMVRVTGYASATVTNLSTGKSLTYQVSGPGVWTSFSDGAFAFDGGGVGLFWTEYKNSFEDVPQLNYTKGHVQFHVDADGLTTSYQLSGSSTDVCAALAG